MLIDEFLNYMKYELNRSQRTVESYAEDLKHFEAYFQHLSEQLTWDTVDSDVVRGWMEQMMDKGNSVASVCRRLSALRTLYRFALTRHYVESNPAHAVKSPKKGKPLPHFLKEKEMDILLDRQRYGEGYDETLAYTIIALFYETGIRLSELVDLDDEKVDFINRQIKVRGKGDKQRIIPFGDELEAILHNYLAERDAGVEKQDAALIVSEKGQRMKPAAVRKIVKVRISQVSSLSKRSPHVLRHTFATAMLNHDADIESLKQLLGHASVSTTEIYTHTTFEQLKRVYNNAHPRA